ncbi:hypothetical protein [Variovorax sp. YR216]|uniref:hypothetical protein n=1 Tax=Variovorax sp. YR216 TaxID=1882828 RepID=UPI000894A563|nr:hypothetical protein [Variovorax sp. YR216]SEA48962.1 hypothetical protein SAMN05444680_102623 [Variovorax sp. YR216]
MNDTANPYILYGAPGSGAPRMADVVRRVDADPRLADFWAARFPFIAGWEGRETA